MFASIDFSYRRLKLSTLIVVGASHFLLLYFIWHVEAKSPNFTDFSKNAIQIRFIQTKKNDSVQESITDIKKIPTQPKMIPKSEKEMQVSVATPKNIKNEIIHSAVSKKTVAQENQRNTLTKENKITAQPQKAISKSSQRISKEELSLVNADITSTEQIRRDESKDKMTKHSGGEDGKDLRKEPVAASVPAQPMQVPVSSVDVISFGKLNYDDRELQNQQRLLMLTIRINAKGQPVDVKVKQSSGLPSLDQKGIQAAQKAKFKAHKVNGEAVAIMVDFPIQLKLSRSR